ncbi:pentatricopeptide (PPR) repeat protein [Medicago truncatula]|uniref:Pentatricopeptide (PPR) repeat protein n=1 Tax=Medicago truncatula TaxID=3880 RepID=A0A072UQU3_MEDTR|nr:pentatricopeptide (PPR) repeat protein [Medicago truncatula]
MSHFSFMARFLLPRTSFYSVPVPTIFENSKSSFSSISFKTHSKNDNFSDTKQQITTLCSKGHIKKAFESFLYGIWTEPRLFSILIQSCIPTNSVSLGKQLHSLIFTSGYSSDKFISNHLLNFYSKFGELNNAVKLFDRMPRRNYMSCNIMIKAYLEMGNIENAKNLFDEMTERNVATWNAMVTGLVKFGLNEEALLFSRMNVLGFVPDEYSFGSVLRGCAHLRALSVGDRFTLMLRNVGERIIKWMPNCNLVAWNTLMAGKAQNRCFDGVLDHYCMMKMAGYRPDRITFVSVISSCSELATLCQGKQIHAEVIKAGASSVVTVISSLVSMYSKCGSLQDSIKAFLECEERDVVLWSSMIAAYGFHGQCEKAIKLFNDKEKENMAGNEVTFLSLLYACSHSGLKDKGLDFFDMMVEKYGLKARLEHYTCVVDLLGRSGCLEEAETIIRSMPVSADAIIWKTLLSACKIHKNEEMARRVAEEVLRIDPQDPASYVLIAGIHASAKRWQNVSEVRRAMKDKMVKKEPGVSWVEVKNQVHQFHMGDESHSKFVEINQYLEELTSEMKMQGYVPDISSVLHDMDNEEKEYNLTHHSEKLAIAFALMTIPKGEPIRVMKNMRVCGDCHVAIKYISEIKNLEIIVRDSSRFHHFKNGRCHTILILVLVGTCFVIGVEVFTPAVSDLPNCDSKWKNHLWELA